MRHFILTVFILFSFVFVSKGQWADLYSNSFYNSLNTVFFTSAQIGYVGGSSVLSGVVLKTTDGGITWNPAPCPTVYPVAKLYFLSVDTGFLLSVNSQLYRTTNGGLTWTYLRNLGFYSIGVPLGSCNLRAYGNTIYVTYEYSSYIYRSNNRGAAWDSAYMSYGGAVNGFKGVAMRSPTAGIAYGTIDSHYTTNGGTSWSNFYTPYLYYSDMKFINSDTGFATHYYDQWNAQYCFERTYNASSITPSWVFTSASSGSGIPSGVYGANGFAVTQSRKLFMLTYNRTTYAPNRYSYIYFSNNLGTTWIQLTYPSPLNQLNDIYFLNDSIGYAVGNYGRIITFNPLYIGYPTIPSSSVYFTGITDSTVTLNWTKGNGSRRIVVARAINNLMNNPVYGTTYNADSVFGHGSQIGSGNYVVYDGSDSSVRIHGLSTYTAYFFRIYEYNGIGSTANYLTTTYGSSGTTTLPVKFLFIDAKHIENMIRLVWQTASEVNNEKFEIERCSSSELNLPGVSWDVIGTVKGNGTTNALSEYEFTDENVFPEFARSGKLAGTVYYRLKQIDFDGKITYSPIVTVNIPSHSKGIVIYPLPIDGILNIDNPDGGEMRVLIKDIQGRELLNDNANGVSYTKKVDNLSAGLYYLNIIRNGDNRVIKIIKN